MIQNSFKGSYADMAKASEAQYAANRRWDTANLKRYAISFRYDTDQALIDFIEANKGKDGTSQLFKEALELLMNSRD